jgi:hypothetical protein
MMTAYAVFCMAMLLVTFFWIAWERGARVLPFDALMASTAPSVAEQSSVSPIQTVSLDAPLPERIADTAGNAEPGISSDAPLTAQILGEAAASEAEVVDERNGTGAGAPAGWTPASITAGLAHNDEILTIVVEREVTLRELSIQYIGRFDEIVREEVVTLNPDGHIAGKIEAGQRLRLPLYLRRGFKRLPWTETPAASFEELKDPQ